MLSHSCIEKAICILKVIERLIGIECLGIGRILAIQLRIIVLASDQIWPISEGTFIKKIIIKFFLVRIYDWRDSNIPLRN